MVLRQHAHGLDATRAIAAHQTVEPWSFGPPGLHSLAIDAGRNLAVGPALIAGSSHPTQDSDVYLGRRTDLPPPGPSRLARDQLGGVFRLGGHGFTRRSRGRATRRKLWRESRPDLEWGLASQRPEHRPRCDPAPGTLSYT